MVRERRLSFFWTLQLGGWGLFGAALAAGRVGEFSLARLAVFDGALVALGFLTTLGLGALYARLRIREARLARVVGLILLASYGAAVLWTAAYHLYLHHWAPDLLALLSGDPAPLRGRLELLDNTVYNTLGLLAWSMIYVGGEYHRAVREERERALRAEAQAHRAQLRALRYQLNPHFLFNTMNAISTLVGEGRSREARTMISRLSDFLRLTLEGETTPEVALADEIDFVRRYLDIEQVRFGDRLRVHVDVADDVHAAAVPVLLLQPLVENAVVHAVSPREAGGRITLAARRRGRRLELTVTDDGPGLAAPIDRTGHGIGLANTRERLREIYGEAHDLTLERPEAGGVRVVIRIPLRLHAPSTDGLLDRLAEAPPP